MTVSKIMCAMKSALGVRSKVKLCCWYWVMYHQI